MAILIKHIDGEPYVDRATGPDGTYLVPGMGPVPANLGMREQTKFLGANSQDGPWVYLVERPAGDVVPMHKHQANRMEFILEGEIEWRDSEGREATYGAGTMTYVTANTAYSYVTTRPTRILLWFDARPSNPGV